jgi:hypothetical protein
VRRSPRPSVEDVALEVGDALRRHGIAAVLTGGACAGLHAKGRYTSADVDFVLADGVQRKVLDAAMRDVGFARRGDRYVQPTNPIWVEFPRGPLAIGYDDRLTPVVVRRGRNSILALSPTDSCRDRLAAFYHWGDWQALAVAVEIALANRLAYATIRRWSIAEESEARYQGFLAAVREARRSRKR